MRRSPRVVSLVPSLTETVLAWGIEPVACTRFCEQPGRPHVGGTKDPDVAAIVALAPDLVLMDAEENRREDHDELVAAGVEVHAVRIRSISEVDEQLGALAEHLGAVWHRLELPDHAPPTRTAVVPIWKRPWMFLGTPTYGSSLLEVAGVANALAGRGPYPQLDLDDATRLGADLVVAPDEPYPFAERHRSQLETVAPAVFVDGRDLLWWGERSRRAVERLRTALEHLTPEG